MSYFAMVVFDIKAGKPDDYQKIYDAYAKMGLKREILSGAGKNIKLPTTTTVGTFEGANVTAIRDDLLDRTKSVFKSNKLTGEIFIAVGGNWTWGQQVI